MARGLLLAASVLDDSLEAVVDRCDGGTLRVYSGTQPATADTTVGGTLLAEMTFATPAFTVASGVATANALIIDLANATGTATWFRAFTSADAPVFDGSVGEADADLIIDDDGIVTGERVEVTELTFQLPSPAPVLVYNATGSPRAPAAVVTGAGTYIPEDIGPPPDPGLTIYGFGSAATGGTGGTIRNVATVAELRTALTSSGTRIVRFTAGGDYNLAGADITITNGNLTFTGEFASGPVIIHNGMVFIRANNVIQRHICFRGTGPNLSPGDGDTDSLTVGLYNGSVRYSDIVIDHCEMIWGPDVTMTLLGALTNVTVQYCVIGEGLFASVHPESFGGPAGDQDGHSLAFNCAAHSGHDRITLYSNLFTTSQSRFPRFQNVITTDVINNVFYNYHEGPQGAARGLNLMNNYYKEGPAPAAAGLSTPVRLQFRSQVGGESSGITAQSVYANGNLASNFTFQNPSGNDATIIASTPRHTPSISGADLRTAANAYTHVLANAGARLPSMDSHTTRILNNVLNGTGKYRDGYTWSSGTHHYPPVEH